MRHRLHLEALEDRRLLTANLNFTAQTPEHLDVNRDGIVTAVDALQVINALQTRTNPAEQRIPLAQPQYDVNRDGEVTAVDALWVINYLNEEAATLTAALLQSEPNPSANVTLPTSIRQRDVVTLTLNSITDLNLTSIDAIDIDWGDGRLTSIAADALTLPVSTLHAYHITPSNQTVTVRARTANASPITLSTSTINLQANSPAVVDRVDEGLTASIFEDGTFGLIPDIVRTDPTIDFRFGTGGPDPRIEIGDGPFAVRWQGKYTPDQTLSHSLHAITGSNDQVKVIVDNVTLINTFGSPTGNEQTASVVLTAGVPINLIVEYIAGAGDSSIQVGIENQASFKTSLPSHLLTPAMPAGVIRRGVLVEEFPITSTTTVAEIRGTTAFIINTPTAGFDQTDFTYANSTAGLQGTRTRGLLTAPVSGQYTFQLSATDQAELWLSQGVTSDTSRKIATVSASNPATSASAYLVAGQTYYVETLHAHRESTTTGQLSLSWTRPDNVAASPQLITGDDIRPVVPQVKLHADVSTTHEADVVSRHARFVITRNDDFGRSLDVPYTLGGSAIDGIDYTALSGIATIPAGSKSVIVELDPIDDNFLENAETAIVRLVTDPRYQLAAESERHVVLTIQGELQNETQLLLQDFTVFDTTNFKFLAAGNTVTTFTETDTTLPFVGSTPANNAYRINVNNATPSSPWETLIGFGFNGNAYPTGTPFLASVWARSANTDGSSATVGVRLQKDGDNYAGDEQVFEVGSEWTLLLLPVTPDFDGGTPDRTIDVRVGYQTQIVELGGFSLVKLDSVADLEAAPQTIHAFGGRQWDAAWRETAAIQAATQRTNPVQITIVDAAGNPIEGAVVTITPTAPSLLLGTEISPERIDPNNTTLENERYRAIVARYFDSLTDGGSAQWGPWSENSQLPTDVADWIVAQDLPYHGHSLIWGQINPYNFPTPQTVKATYDAFVSSDGEPAARAWLRNEVLAHVTTTGPGEAFAGTRPGSTQPTVTWWDVINHPTFSPELWNLASDGTEAGRAQFMYEVIQAAATSIHPDTGSIINEFEILSIPDGARTDEFESLLQALDAAATADPLNPSNRAAYDTIGFQSHFVSSRLPSIDRIIEELVRYEAFDRKLQVTEFDVDALSIDRQTQADFTRDFYQTLAANPAVTAATMWGFWANEHWRESPTNNEAAALFNPDWTPRANGQWLLDVQHAKDQTATFSTDTNGRFYSAGQTTQWSIAVEGIATPFDIVIDESGSVVLTLSDQQSRTVTTANDAGAGSLRAAIVFANSVLGHDSILFNILGVGSHTINLSSALPILTDTVTIDGTSEPGYAGVPVIGVDGSGVVGDGLHITATAAGSTVSALAFHGFAGDAIEINGGSGNMISSSYLGLDLDGNSDGNSGSGVRIVGSSGNTIHGNVISANSAAGISIYDIASSVNVITGNKIGTSIDGMTAKPNAQGILLENAPNNHIGLPGLGNQISGNSVNGIAITGAAAIANQIQGNRIGLDTSGNGPLANIGFGVVLAAPGNFVGSAVSGGGNVISGNSRSGVLIASGGSIGSVIRNNRIGTSANGLTAVANHGYGVYISGSPSNSIGGTGLNEGNLISGNGRSGVLILGQNSTTNLLQGNTIGLNHDRTAAIANAEYAVFVMLPGIFLAAKPQVPAIPLPTTKPQPSCVVQLRPTPTPIRSALDVAIWNRYVLGLEDC